jgi:hypothetical protein
MQITPKNVVSFYPKSRGFPDSGSFLHKITDYVFLRRQSVNKIIQVFSCSAFDKEVHG